MRVRARHRPHDAAAAPLPLPVRRPPDREAHAPAPGRVVDLRDTLIAGIAQTRRATIATRNTRRFEGLNVPVVDPWQF
jgi:hypothetical protein